MSTILDIWYTGRNSPEENMARDQRFLQELNPNGSPILHHYQWEGPCATYGHFIKPETLLDMDAAQAYGLQLARRPTGGGIIFHLSDLAFSFLLPAGHPSFSLNTLENYALVNRLVVEALIRLTHGQVRGELLGRDPEARDWACKHFCMAKPTKYDVVVGGRKVGGAAQRRTKQGFLHQGTISLARLPRSLVNAVFLPSTQVAYAMEQNSFLLLEGDDWKMEELEEVRKRLRNHLSDVFEEHFSITKTI